MRGPFSCHPGRALARAGTHSAPCGRCESEGAKIMGPGSPEPRTRASSGRDDNGVREATRCALFAAPKTGNVGWVSDCAGGRLKNESRKRPTNKCGLTHRFFVLRDWLRVLLLSVIPCAMRHPYAASQTRDLGSSKCALNKIPDQRRINIGLLRRIRDDGCEVPARVRVFGCGAHARTV